MRHSLVLVLATVLLTACTSYRLADEPADLVARGRDIPSLTKLGWEISAPMSASDIAADQNLRDYFFPRLAPGDELRPVRNNAGIGYAVFRGGVLVDLFLTTVF